MEKINNNYTHAAGVRFENQSVGSAGQKKMVERFSLIFVILFVLGLLVFVGGEK